MRNKRATFFSLAILLLCTLRLAVGQDQNRTGTDSKASAMNEKQTPPQTKPVQPYRLDFSLVELQNGKRTNTRHYSLNLTAGSGDEIKIGTRVPVRSGSVKNDSGAVVSTQFQYLDVGTNIWAFLREVGDELQLEVKGDVSDLDKAPNSDLGPIIRQMKISGSTLLVTGKPIIIGSMDDPNSDREFQLEVTATKLR
ncbi:MAG TPA: hypothetical protein VJO35_14175 [Terriglobales bacterium]|nr:hypothetical protein [Terriglobales bacterium]